jgi:hypothetical protein
MHGIRQRADHERFCKTRNSDKQRVSASDERHDQFVEYLVLPDYPLLNLRPQPGRRGPQAVAIRALRGARRSCDVSGQGACVDG